MPLALTTVFADLPAPRRDMKNRLHMLTNILVIATCAVIAGADGWEQVAAYGHSKEDFFRRFLALPNGIPSHDTFNRVFARLDPEAFADRFRRWATGACEGAGLVHVAIDGKSARRSPKGTFTGCLHLVEAWAVESQLLLGVRSVPEGGHEITTIPELIAALDLTGAVVTIDAAGCQKETVEQIRARGGDYLVCVKGNQPVLRDAVASVFERAGEAAFVGCSITESAEDGHGRHEERYVTVVESPEGLPDRWADVGAVIPVGRERQVGGTANESTAHYYLTSLRARAEVLVGYPQPLGDREQAALVPRRIVPGGREPGTGRPRGGESGDRSAGRAIAAEASRYKGERPNPPHESRLGRRLHAQSPTGNHSGLSAPTLPHHQSGQMYILHCDEVEHYDTDDAARALISTHLVQPSDVSVHGVAGVEQLV